MQHPLSCSQWRHRAYNAVHTTPHHTDMTKSTINDLVEQGRHAASLYDECDTALTQLNDAFGIPYEASRSNLTNDLIQADVKGLDLSIFQGKESLFKYPDFSTHIVVRINRVASGNSKLTKIDQRIAVMEEKLKLLKLQRKHLVTELATVGAVDFITDKITTVFSRLK